MAFPLACSRRQVTKATGDTMACLSPLVSTMVVAATFCFVADSLVVVLGLLVRVVPWVVGRMVVEQLVADRTVAEQMVVTRVVGLAVDQTEGRVVEMTDQRVVQLACAVLLGTILAVPLVDLSAVGVLGVSMDLMGRGCLRNAVLVAGEVRSLGK